MQHIAVRTQMNGCRTKNSTTWGNNGDILYRRNYVQSTDFNPSSERILNILSETAGTADVVTTLAQGSLGQH